MNLGTDVPLEKFNLNNCSQFNDESLLRNIETTKNDVNLPKISPNESRQNMTENDRKAIHTLEKNNRIEKIDDYRKLSRERDEVVKFKEEFSVGAQIVLGEFRSIYRKQCNPLFINYPCLFQRNRETF